MFLIPKSYYKIRTSKKKGRGVFALRDIEAGTVIGDYLGKIIRPNTNDEKKNGMYHMRGGDNYDILGNPKEDGIHLLNHSCSHNCDVYPYQGHILAFALRHIFKGEELSLNYSMGLADESEKGITCQMHTCHCESAYCTGSMHENESSYDGWEVLLKREFGPWYKKVPGTYGSKLQPLDEYPASLRIDDVKSYDYSAFGSEKKSPIMYANTSLPPLHELKHMIRETGRTAAFPKLHLLAHSVRNKIIRVERT